MTKTFVTLTLLNAILLIFEHFKLLLFQLCVN
jgi:hypothetical protein